MKHFIQKIIYKLKYGVDCCDVFSFDYYIARKILNGLKLFKKLNYSHPCNLTEKKWDKIIDQMIEGFDIYVNDEDFDYGFEKNKTKSKKVDLALTLFKKHFHSLWL